MRQIPGSSHLNNDQLQSDSEAELFNWLVSLSIHILRGVSHFTIA